ncbi:peptidyl-tRNA hydrolase, PTH2 family [Nematocida sp. AWRm77]|nr:peptidyl-tRNA hydrolase, PTH2 family [Nematocida sp. AWRm77]
MFYFIWIPIGLIASFFYWIADRCTRPKLKDEPIKAVLLVRKDIPMTKGKITAQAMHAAYAAGCVSHSNRLAQKWKKYGFKKVSLQVQSEAEMQDITEKAEKEGISVFPVTDAGRTQVEPNTWTVTLIGPYYESDLNKITGQLKLL